MFRAASGEDIKIRLGIMSDSQSSHHDHSCNGHAGNTFSILNTPDEKLNRIIRKESLGPVIRLYEVYCPAIAGYCEPGQFIVVRGDEKSERVPLTIADFDRAAGTITMVVQIVGLASGKLDVLQQGDRFQDIVGPLGHASEVEKFGTVVCIGGGLGIAPVYPIQRKLKDAGNTVYSIMGARNKDLIFWEEKMRAACDQAFIVTDDGSYGEKGFVTTALEKLIKSGERIDRVIAIGPPIMMRVVCDLTRQYNIKTIVSLNSIMVDGTGMCGGCRVEVGGKTRFTCVDGPEFDGHEVNFAMLFQRLSTYKQEEGRIYEEFKKEKELVGKAQKAAARVPMPAQDPLVRARNFEEVALGYTAEMAQAEALRCIQCKNPKCVEGCPVNVDIPGFIKEIQQGHFLKAAQKIKATNNLPAVCGRVCPQESQCEAKCILGVKSQPVAIGRLERFAADTESAIGQAPLPKMPASSGKRVAIIGSGPAGLTAAADLAMLGHSVTVFEALHSPGGVLAYGIPEFRLPKAIVKRECEYLQRLGVEFRYNMPIGLTLGVPELKEAGYDAVFIGTGAGLPAFMGIPGENLNGVYSSNEFLTRINLMKAYRDDYDTPVLRGRNVAVVGGGNVAMDAARSALRLGAENVYIVYRRSRKEMPAREEEVAHALEEGVVIRELTNPVEVLGDEKGWVTGLKCQLMALGEPDASGRRKPVEVPGSEHVLEIDQFIVAIGQGPNPMLTRNWPELQLDKRGNIVADEQSFATNVPGVYAGGDIVSGAATVILAMGAGKSAAKAMDAYLRTL